MPGSRTSRRRTPSRPTHIILTNEQRRRLRDLLTLVVYDKLSLFSPETRRDLQQALIAVDNTLEPESDRRLAIRLARYDSERVGATW